MGAQMDLSSPAPWAPASSIASTPPRPVPTVLDIDSNDMARWTLS
jgi:hypothetical protein